MEVHVHDVISLVALLIALLLAFFVLSALVLSVSMPILVVCQLLQDRRRIQPYTRVDDRIRTRLPLVQENHRLVGLYGIAHQAICRVRGNCCAHEEQGIGLLHESLASVAQGSPYIFAKKDDVRFEYASTCWA